MNSPGAPRDAIVLSSVDWDFNWQGQHEISARLAARGGKVLFVENTGSRAPRWSDLERIGTRARRWLGGPVRAAARARSDVTVYAPIVAPYPWHPASRVIDRVIFVPAVRRLAASLQDPLIWAFLPTPATVDAIRACRTAGSAVAYYCVSDFSTVSEDPEGLHRTEDALLDECDVVFTNGDALRHRYAGRHDRVYVHPFGVDTMLFDPTRTLTVPKELEAIPRPWVGYIGALHRHMARDWLVSALDHMPDVAFVFVGPIQPDTDLSEVAARRNAYFLGPRDHAELPAFVAAFDVCLIPYAHNAYTRSVVPTKLFEYLAMGRPIVSTALPELLATQGLSRLVNLVNGPAEFARAIRTALGDPGDDGRRRAYAMRFGWDSSLENMISEMDEARRAHRE